MVRSNFAFGGSNHTCYDCICFLALGIGLDCKENVVEDFEVFYCDFLEQKTLFSSQSVTFILCNTAFIFKLHAERLRY